MTDRKEELLAAARNALLPGGPDATHSMPSDREAEVRVALLRLKRLYHEGLISRIEAEERRTELLEDLKP